MAMDQQTQANSTPTAVPQPVMGYTPPTQQFGQVGMGTVPMGYAGIPQQYVPQGFVGNLLGQIGGPAGSLIGGYFGQPQLGQAIGSAAGQLASQYLPFSAQVPGMQQAVPPQFVPQSFLNDLLTYIMRPPIPTLPNIPVPPFILPFSAQAPGMQQAVPQQLVPQGLLGNLLGQVIGGPLGGVLGTLLPFSAQVPGMQQAVPQQLVPQGLVGNVLGAIGGPVGSAIGGYFGNPQLGGAIGSALGQAATFLPFSAQVPGMQQAVPQQLVPQSFLSDLLATILRPSIPGVPTPPFIPGVPTPPFVLPFSAQVPGVQQAYGQMVPGNSVWGIPPNYYRS